jgi:hypothetical protein
MAGTACALAKRFMGLTHSESLFRFLVACVAQARLFGRKKFLVTGSVSYMAGKTFPPTRDRLMGDFYRHALALMTCEAQFFAFLGEEEGILRSMGIMAGIALSLLKRYVLHIAASLEI